MNKFFRKYASGYNYDDDMIPILLGSTATGVGGGLIAAAAAKALGLKRRGQTLSGLGIGALAAWGMGANLYSSHLKSTSAANAASQTEYNTNIIRRILRDAQNESNRFRGY